MNPLWLAGAENPSHFNSFILNGVSQVALNVGSLVRNYSSAFKGFGKDAEDHFDWLAWSDSDSSLDDLLDVINIMGFMPTYVVGPTEWSSHERYLPVWTGSDQLRPTDVGVVITDGVFKDSNQFKQALSSRRRNSVLGVITGRPKDLDKFDLVISTSWYNVQSLGETHIWTGEELRRFPAPKKDECRTKYAAEIDALNIDVQAVADDDMDALINLSMRSWMALGEALERPDLELVVDNVSDLHPVISGSGDVVPTTDEPKTRHVIPTLKLITEDVDEGQRTKLSSVSESVRKCDNCFLAASCPQWNPGADCAYDIPVEIRTKDQMTAVMETMLEIQTQRVLMSRFAEEVQGQELDERTGQEIERLFNLLEKMRKVESPVDGFKMMIEGSGMMGAQAAQGGVLSRLFGAEVGDNAKAINPPMPTDVVDAEEVDGE